VALNVDLLDIPTVIDSEDKPMPDSTKTGDFCNGCGNEIVIYATGICNHTVCHLCGLRSRVIFLNDKCRVCKENMPLLILTKTKRDFEEIIGEKLFVERRNKICFENEFVKGQYEKLLIGSLMSLSMETSNWTNSEFWSSTLPKIRCESCDCSTCHHVYMSGTTYNMMTHFDSNNNKIIKNENFCFRTKRQRILDLENDLKKDLKKDQGNVLEEEDDDDLENNGLRIKTRRFTLDFEDIYDYSMKIKLESRTT
jgi:hypothetical protein